MLRRCAVAILIAGLALLPPEAQACSVCLGWTEGQGLNGGFYWSALLLTLLPFAVVAVIGAWVRHALRRSSGGGAPVQASHTTEPVAIQES